MTLKTLGMGIAKLITKKAKVVKKEFVSPKTNTLAYYCNRVILLSRG